jgi:hypothetical protein
MSKFKLFLALLAFVAAFFSGCTSNVVSDGNSSDSGESSLSSSSRPVGTLSCGSVASTGTVGQPLTIPAVTCNGSTVTGTAITWSGAPDWNSPAAGTYSNVMAGVIAGTCGGVQASCAGTLVVSAPSSSSSPPDNTPIPTLENLTGSNARTGTTTRYWDACKPSCGWPNNTGSSPNGTAKSCDVKGSTIGNNIGSACPNGGSAYACMNQAPWRKSDNVSYGFAATPTNGDCGKCYHLQFSNTAISGKKMIVMVSNIGGDVKSGQFDIMIPGGGVGIYNALSTQVSQNGGSSSDLGSQYGGFRTKCGSNATCVRNMCNSVFSTAALSDLKNGCLWYVDWFQIADNPNIYYKEINCPSDLVGRYK